MKISDTRVPAGGVVVIGPLSKGTESRLMRAATGKLAKIPGTPPTHVVESKAGDPRKLWERINKLVGDEGVVAPVLVDDEGNRLLPTGRLQVRFEQPPSDEALAKFAERHRVELSGRNKWAPQQAEFAVRADDVRYLPDVASELKRDKSVAAAWPDVRAAYRRGAE
jgi:hypothetical protein